MAEPKKEESYREALSKLLERSGAPRAAFYLMEPDGDLHLAAHCGFSPRDLPPAAYGKDHPLFERLNHFRKPFYFNSPVEAAGLRDEMERSHTARLLLAPMYEEGRLVGLVEARDKSE